ncbi:OB-fold domain-containing protein [Novosphingobium sp.]|uniref:Zn-ribbon domain-containing OB-fold protein n=1 Tax=Novosphingobium sp. TaxID=1874826 RepID=UPI0025E5F98B|nr:OB-fold domain-containing protein [Novosphingobium sp.]
MSGLSPIAEGLWTDEAKPRLIGGRLQSGQIVFPMPEGDAAQGVEPYNLSRKGTLWSFTSQDFRPKSPYEGPGEGPHDFKPYLIGYIELPGEVIVESLIVDATLNELRLGMPMEFAVVPFNAKHTTFAFRPEQRA